MRIWGFWGVLWGGKGMWKDGVGKDSLSVCPGGGGSLSWDSARGGWVLENGKSVAGRGGAWVGAGEEELDLGWEEKGKGEKG